MAAESEKAVLGAVLLENAALEEVQEVLEPEDFRSEQTRLVYLAMLDMAAEGKPIDLLTLKNELVGRGQLKAAGGAAGVAALSSDVPTAANVAYYARAVRAESMRRTLMAAFTEARERLESDPDSIQEVASDVEAELYRFSTRRSGAYQRIRELVHQAADEVEALVTGKAKAGVPTGLSDLDGKIGGFKRGDLVVIGARASIGKTALALTMAKNMAQEHTVGFFSAEMAGASLVKRLASMKGRISSTGLATGAMTHSEFSRFVDTMGELYDMRLIVYDRPNARLDDVRSKARRMVGRDGAEVVFIDYLGLLKSGRNFRQRNEEVAYISRELKELARELNVPVVALAQLNRHAENREPSMAELAESGAIEQDADLIMLLHRDRNSLDTETVVKIEKHRNGPTGRVRLAFIRDYVVFEDLLRGEPHGKG